MIPTINFFNVKFLNDIKLQLVVDANDSRAQSTNCSFV